MLGLEKTKKSLFARMGSMFSRDLDDEFYDSLEETLILSDVGVQTAEVLIEKLRAEVKDQKLRKAEDAKALIASIAAGMMQGDKPEFGYPLLLLIVGVNGSGKTTSIAKLSLYFKKHGKKVLLAAGDTFRAAAIDQLAIWAERTGAQFIHGQPGGDPAAVLFDAIASGKARGCDVLLCDTAGRLQNRKNLMDELAKMRRVTDRDFSGCVKTLLVLDATTGLNGMEQARVFEQASKVDGIVLTKLDGTAKGGVALAIAHQYRIPVWFCGTGEGMEDLEAFDAQDFAKSLFL